MKLRFTNIKGQGVSLDSNLTMVDLVKMGIRLNLEPREQPKSKSTKFFYHDPKSI